jgi:hypothetical protein
VRVAFLRHAALHTINVVKKALEVFTKEDVVELGGVPLTCYCSIGKVCWVLASDEVVEFVGLILDLKLVTLRRYVDYEAKHTLVVDIHDELLILLVVSKHDQFVLSVTNHVVKAAEDGNFITYSLVLRRRAFENLALEVIFILELIDLHGNVAEDVEVASDVEEAANQIV